MAPGENSFDTPGQEERIDSRKTVKKILVTTEFGVLNRGGGALLSVFEQRRHMIKTVFQ